MDAIQKYAQTWIRASGSAYLPSPLLLLQRLREYLHLAHKFGFALRLSHCWA
jgi:hypothetical protein